MNLLLVVLVDSCFKSYQSEPITLSTFFRGMFTPVDAQAEV
jgi:hypothetical protein